MKDEQRSSVEKCLERLCEYPSQIWPSIHASYGFLSSQNCRYCQDLFNYVFEARVSVDEAVFCDLIKSSWRVEKYTGLKVSQYWFVAEKCMGLKVSWHKLAYFPSLNMSIWGLSEIMRHANVEKKFGSFHTFFVNNWSVLTYSEVYSWKSITLNGTTWKAAKRVGNMKFLFVHLGIWSSSVN